VGVSVDVDVDVGGCIVSVWGAVPFGSGVRSGGGKVITFNIIHNEIPITIAEKAKFHLANVEVIICLFITLIISITKKMSQTIIRII